MTELLWFRTFNSGSLTRAQGNFPEIVFLREKSRPWVENLENWSISVVTCFGRSRFKETSSLPRLWCYKKPLEVMQSRADTFSNFLFTFHQSREKAKIFLLYNTRPSHWSTDSQLTCSHTLDSLCNEVNSRFFWFFSHWRLHESSFSKDLLYLGRTLWQCTGARLVLKPDPRYSDARFKMCPQWIEGKCAVGSSKKDERL